MSVGGHGTGGPTGRFAVLLTSLFHKSLMRNVCFRVAVALLTVVCRQLAAQPPAQHASLDSAGLGAWLDSLVPRALSEGKIAGAVIVVVKGGRILLGKGYGFADVARRVPMDPNQTLVSVGSVSKLFTWTAAMQQVQHGKLDLERDVSQYLDFKIPEAFGKPITLRHLMTHTAGFEDRAFRRYRKPRALQEHLKGTPVPERIFPPGEVSAYSNYGSMLAGYMVERASGERFVDYVERHIFEPLGMQRSSFRRPPPAPLAVDLAQSYETSSDEPLPRDALDHEEPSGDPSGHLMTTGSDIARFMIAHLQRGRYQDTELLSPAVADLMHSPAVEPIPAPGGNAMTLGFFRTDRNGHRVISHAGVIEAFHADLQLLPDAGVGFFLALNSTGTPHGLFGAGLFFQTNLFRQFMDQFFPAPVLPDEPTATTAKEHSRLVAGEYEMSRRGTGDFVEVETLLVRAAVNLVITNNEDGTIETPPILDFARGEVRRWREVGPFVWREVGGDGWLDAKVENGRVIALLPRDIYSFVLQPVDWTRSAKGNVALLVGAAVVLALTVLLWPIRTLRARRSGRPMPSEWRFIHFSALVGLIYLLAWVVLLGGGIPTREGGELWVRLVQAIGLLAIAAAAVSLRGVWLVASRKLGWVHLAGSVLVTLAMLELVWLSLGFHLLSARLVY